MPAAKTGGIGMDFQTPQHAAEDLSLHAFELRHRRQNLSHPFGALGNLKLLITKRHRQKLGLAHFQPLRQQIDAAAGLFFARLRRRTPKPVEKSHRNALRRQCGDVRKKRARAETRARATLRSDAITVTCYGGSLLDPADETSARALQLSSTKAAKAPPRQSLEESSTAVRLRVNRKCTGW
jgi:hypothetical protein